jgi:hypothetical protein
MRSRRRSPKSGVQAEKQQRYVQLIAQGVNNTQACRIVGINRKTGTDRTPPAGTLPATIRASTVATLTGIPRVSDGPAPDASFWPECTRGARASADARRPQGGGPSAVTNRPL